MKISDTHVALLVLRGDITASTSEKAKAVHFLKENGLFWRLSGDLQNDGKAVLAAATRLEEGL